MFSRSCDSNPRSVDPKASVLPTTPQGPLMMPDRVLTYDNLVNGNYYSNPRKKSRTFRGIVPSLLQKRTYLLHGRRPVAFMSPHSITTLIKYLLPLHITLHHVTSRNLNRWSFQSRIHSQLQSRQTCNSNLCSKSTRSDHQ